MYLAYFFSGTKPKSQYHKESTIVVSASRVEVKVVVSGKGTACAELFRHLSPITVSTLLRMTPLSGRVLRFRDDFVYMMCTVSLGVEKARRSFKQGEVGFMASANAICFFLKDCIVARPVNPLGKLTSGIEVLEGAGAGDVITVDLIQPNVPSS